MARELSRHERYLSQHTSALHLEQRSSEVFASVNATQFTRKEVSCSNKADTLYFGVHSTTRISHYHATRQERIETQRKNGHCYFGACNMARRKSAEARGNKHNYHDPNCHGSIAAYHTELLSPGAG